MRDVDDGIDRGFAMIGRRLGGKGEMEGQFARPQARGEAAAGGLDRIDIEGRVGAALDRRGAAHADSVDRGTHGRHSCALRGLGMPRPKIPGRRT
jgi:hypothetical protein